LAKIEEGVPGSIPSLQTRYITNTCIPRRPPSLLSTNDFVLTAPVTATLIRVEKAENAFAQLLEMYNQVKLNKKGISKLSFMLIVPK
jgi:UDP-3-O-[3-hydroxymyristoyl] glucosamine N-acyltransferase